MQVVDVGMCVRVMRAVVCYSVATISKLSRSASGKRQPQELVGHRIRTATRKTLSVYGLRGQLRLA